MSETSTDPDRALIDETYDLSPARPTPALTSVRLVRLSEHARHRAARRNVVPDAVDYVLTYGRSMHRTGVAFYFLAWRDIPRRDQRQSAYARLAGTVVIVGRGGEIITVYRNVRAWHHISRKMKYRLTEEQLGRAWPEDDEEEGLADEAVPFEEDERSA